ncbi:hypothetical protein X777_02614 [Ooceraea biroi]|uniref:Uncharacterized protein n=1 Tax=Ooceraea biroi TaxID=2015173 RepID=A0A026WN32_OOCBI|nr:hypothetical protein X777_02614 [Ooceraea biroi]
MQFLECTSFVSLGRHRCLSSVGSISRSFYDSRQFGGRCRKIWDSSNERAREIEGKEKERRSQLRRHVANCRGLEENRWRRWRRLREGRSGVRIDRKGEAGERAMYATAVRRNDTLRDEVEGKRRPSRRTLPSSLLSSPPRTSPVRFSNCLRAGMTKPAGPRNVNGKRRICLIKKDTRETVP